MKYWSLEKFKNDANVYATCPMCGFSYVAGDTTKAGEGEDTNIIAFNYCPICGENLKLEQKENYGCVWEERTMDEARGEVDNNKGTEE